MTLRLSVDRTAWTTHVQAMADLDGLVPVVKGNGYGLTRAWLAAHAATFAPRIAVGTVWDLADVPADRTALVLTPSLVLPETMTRNAILTVGSTAHVAALRAHGFDGRVTVKLRSSMDRYGSSVDELDALVRTGEQAGLDIDGFALHLPLAGTDDDRITEIDRWLERLPGGAPLSVSHLQPATFADLRHRHPDHLLSLRLGTALWHGDKSALHLEADVIDRRPLRVGASAGYRLGAASGGELLLVGAGTTHGVVPLPDGRSPFHFARRRIDLHEPPHMHTSMLVVDDEGPLPDVGAWVDVQRPLTAITADIVAWT